MTKDPYTKIERLISNAIECVTTEGECYPSLIPSNAVTTQTVHIHQTPRPSSNFQKLISMIIFLLKNSF